MKVNGKDVTLRLDLGAMKHFKELTGRNFFAIGKDEMDPEILGAMVYCFAVRGGSDITMDDVDRMEISELTEIEKEMEKLTGEKKSKNPKAVSPRK